DLGSPLTGFGATFIVGAGMSIQEAIDKASDGDTILIRAGTYEELLSIDGKDLTLIGEGDSTIIVPPAGTIETTITVASSGSPDKSAIITVENATVHIEGIMIDGEGRGNE